MKKINIADYLSDEIDKIINIIPISAQGVVNFLVAQGLKEIKNKLPELQNQLEKFPELTKYIAEAMDDFYRKNMR